MTTPREKLLRKISDLLRLAGNEGATPAEAAVAAQKAQELLLKYSLTEADVEGLAEPQSYVMKNITFCTVAVRLQAYMAVLRVATTASMCKHVYTSSTKKVPATVAIIGSEAQTRVAEYLFEYLSNTLWGMAGQQMPKQYRSQNQFTQNRFRYTFVVAALDEVEKRLEKPLEDARTDTSTQAIMVVNEHMLEEAATRYFPNMVFLKPTRRTISQLAAKLGTEAGKTIPLSTGVETSSRAEAPLLR